MKNSGAAFGGLLHLGDPRVCKLLWPIKDILDKDAVNVAVNCSTGFLYSASVEFEIDWLEKMKGSADNDLFGIVASGLVLQKRKNTYDGVFTGQREFPVCKNPTSEDQKRIRALAKPIAIEDYTKQIARSFTRSTERISHNADCALRLCRMAQLVSLTNYGSRWPGKAGTPALAKSRPAGDVGDVVEAAVARPDPVCLALRVGMASAGRSRGATDARSRSPSVSWCTKSCRLRSALLRPTAASERPSLRPSKKPSGLRSAAVASRWESEQPVPPPIIWRNALDSTREVSARALTYRLDPMPNQKSWTEIPFGMPDRKARNDLPWDPSRPVEIPNTGVIIQGQIDRLDLSGDDRRARVIDYKTGRLNKEMAEVVVNGGSELQRCLYAFAVRTLLGRKVDVEASLLYPRAPEGEQALFPLDDVDAALDLLAGAIAIARTNVENGLALPGIDAADDYNDFAFALPANASYLPRKRPLADQQMGDATKIWEAE